MSSGDGKKIVIKRVDGQGNEIEKLYDSGYTSSTDISYTMQNSGHISIYLFSKNGNTNYAWISFENSSY